MSHESTYQPNSGIERWLDARLPIVRLMHDSFSAFPTPKNLNYWYTFGGILTFCLIVQIVTGITLAMHYASDSALAFGSVEHIMRDVNWGWLIRYTHAVGASMFFLAVYIHMFRGLYYGSYKAPRELLWMLGCIIFLLMMATAFMGYVLPWGQMSFWGATVITNIFSAIPIIGTPIQEWLVGGFAVDNPALTRFFALHYLLPFVIFGVVILHVWALHVTGNNNPTGVEVKGPQDTVPFNPYYTVKDGFALVLFMLIFAAFVFYAPNALGHPDNYIPADPLVTPAHIVPEWYLLPYYAILRSITFDIGIPFTGIVLIEAKLLGVIAMFAAIAVLFMLPWLDTSKVKSLRYRPMLKPFFFLFILACIGLGWVGAESPDKVLLAVGDFQFQMVHLGLTLTVFYFAYFLLILPIVGVLEKPKDIPASIHDSVLEGRKAAPAE
jgi:ubiquinol-cytochrome c reductase cytochrome b subunit